MLSFIKSLLSWKRKGKDQKYLFNEDGEILYEGEVVPQYPPFIKGFPAVPLEYIYKTQEREVRNIYDALDFTKLEFDRLVTPVLMNFVAYVHLLPASERHHHRTQGGMVHHCLEAAFNAAQISRSHIFSTGNTVKEKRDNEERWRVAAMLAGLLHDLGKPATDYTVTDSSGELTWLPYIESLDDWLVNNKVKRYFLRWSAERHKKHENHASLVLYRILTKEIISYLCLHGTEIIQAIDAAISGRDINKPLARIMMEADQASVARDLKRNQIEGASSGFGVPVERYIFEAIRDLISSKSWSVNEMGSRVWLIKDEGAFIDLRNGEAALYAETQKSRIPGIPRRADTIADILIERGYALGSPTKTEGVFNRYWQVNVTVVTAKATAPISMRLLKLNSPELIFAGEPPVAIKGEIERYDLEAQVSQPQETKLNGKPSAVTEVAQVSDNDKAADRPRDFSKLMGDLASIEGEHQPDLIPNAKFEHLAEKVAEKSNASNKDAVSDNQKARDESAVAALTEQLSDRLRSKQSLEIPADPAPADVVSTDPAPTDAVSTDPAPADAVSNKNAKPNRSRKRAKPKTLEQETAAEARKIEKEKREKAEPFLLKNLGSNSVENVSTEENYISLNALLSSMDSEESIVEDEKPPITLKVGIEPRPKKLNDSLPEEEKIPLTPKLPAKNTRTTKRRASSATKAKNETKLPLEQRLTALFGDEAQQALLSLAQEVMRVVTREVPFGVSMQEVKGVYRIEPGVLDPTEIEMLCRTADCDLDTSGAVLLGAQVSEIIREEVSAAEKLAQQDLTENVTRQDQTDEQLEPEYKNITAKEVIDELVEQFYAFGGDMVSPSFSFRDGLVKVNVKETHALIQRKYPQISSNEMRRAIIQKKLLFRGDSYHYTLKDRE